MISYIFAFYRFADLFCSFLFFSFMIFHWFFKSCDCFQLAIIKYRTWGRIKIQSIGLSYKNLNFMTIMLKNWIFIGTFLFQHSKNVIFISFIIIEFSSYLYKVKIRHSISIRIQWRILFLRGGRMSGEDLKRGYGNSIMYS